MRIVRLLGLALIIFTILSGCMNGALESDKPNESKVNDPPITQPDTGSDANPSNSDDTSTESDSPSPDSPSPDSEGNDTNDDATPSVDKVTDAVWMAAGDVMMHMPQLPGAYDSKKNRYNFNPFFTQVKPILDQGDWTLVNLETPIAGKSLGYSGFPRFNAPTELADAVKYAGFDIVTNANNHAMDRGAKGIELTLEKLQKLGLVTKGTARSRIEANALTIVERKGIRMGLLAYTYGTNGIALPVKKPYAVSMIDEAAMIHDIAQLKKAGVDFITISLHFGTEYQTAPNDKQKTLARKLIAAGADIIAGSHPHVVQPYETVEVPEPDGSTRRGLIIYSMGNFISNQRGDTKDYGVIFKVDIHKNVSSGITSIGDVEPIPTWVQRSKVNNVYHYTIVPIEQALISNSLIDLTENDYASINQNITILKQRFASMSAEPYILQESLN
ncbi:hypothetical protein Back11_10360 [Paenibacillus baekrokdamisoli]|uniref:Uncharacterized protein n=1 Tax=Paenibacillus baekrokdamisoli TaxID=1712516 RepID=A0A3G9J1H5_9BACL|nr:CapA family protein [Paenibacillus baekrokdamisoli]MBB3067116.1 poly-gamma-glutamate synthesis protein (capsule biosynthesis protein) [Paenibacillus baekrokdamisoli]BBH19691.1 hypothetical protein Back11_10360 [Paenibacillus baekrokdamisoli]